MHGDPRALARSLGAEAVGEPTRLSGGLLNHVFRVPTASGSVILKVAPPHVAADPSIPLDPARLGFEVRALRAVRGDDGVRVPEVLAWDPSVPAALFEDLGPWPCLGDDPAPGVLRALGGFIGDLHRRSASWDPAPHDNRAVQQTRKAVQYDRVRDVLASLGADPGLARPVEDLGVRLLEPGRCLVMGDLWPASVLVGPTWIGVIDWELSHFGVPAQDLGHLVAHLALGAERAGVPDPSGIFLDAVGPIDAETWRDLRIHAAAEILARLRGPFAPVQADPADPGVARLLARAVGWLTDRA